jgi:hypothetical protein
MAEKVIKAFFCAVIFPSTSSMNRDEAEPAIPL